MKKIFTCFFAAAFILAMTSGIVRAATFIAADGAAHEAGDVADVCTEGSGSAGNDVELEAGGAGDDLECGVKLGVNMQANYKVQCTLTNGTFGVIPGLTTDGAGTLDLTAGTGADVSLTSGAVGDTTLTWTVNNPLNIGDDILLDTTVDATAQTGGDGTGANTAIDINGIAAGANLSCTWTLLNDTGGTLETSTGTIGKGYNCLTGVARNAADSADGPQTDTVTVASGRIAFSDDGTDLVSEAILKITDDNTPGTGGLVAFDPAAGAGFDTTITVTGDFTGVTTVWVDLDGNDTYDVGVDVELTGSGSTRSGLVTDALQPLADGGDSDYTVKILVDGTVQQTRTFQASASSEAKVDTSNDRTDMLATTNFIDWITDGYQGRISYLDTRATVPSFCVVSNTSAGPADVFLDVLANDAGTDVSGLTNISLGTLAAEETALLSFVGDQVTLGSGAPVTVAVGTDARSSSLLTVTVSPNNVLVNCFQSDAATGGKRVLGVYTTDGTGLKQ